MGSVETLVIRVRLVGDIDPNLVTDVKSFQTMRPWVITPG